MLTATRRLDYPQLPYRGSSRLGIRAVGELDEEATVETLFHARVVALVARK